jgi:hypothetical protein
MRQRVRFVCALALATGFAAAGDLAAQRPTAQPGCSMQGKGSFSVGWTETQNDQRYRCTATLDDSLKPGRAAWIKVDKDGKPQD